MILPQSSEDIKIKCQEIFKFLSQNYYTEENNKIYIHDIKSLYKLNERYNFIDEPEILELMKLYHSIMNDPLSYSKNMSKEVSEKVIDLLNNYDKYMVQIISFIKTDKFPSEFIGKSISLLYNSKEYPIC